MSQRFLEFKLPWAALLFTGISVFIVGLAHAERTRSDSANTFVSTYAEDVTTFKRLRGNLTRLGDNIKRRTDLFGTKSAYDTTLLRPEMRQQVLAIWYPLLDNYMALDVLTKKYVRFYRLKDKADRKQAFHLFRGIFLTQYRTALDIIVVLEQNPAVDTILNEANTPLGLPQGIYAQFKYQYLNMIKAGRYTALEAVAKAYKAPRDPELAQWAKIDSQIIMAAGKGPGPKMTLKNGLAIIQKLGHTAWFPVQKGVAEWMGNTKVYRPHQSLIRPEQVQSLHTRLEPGDILLERREWYLTNVGIPGFWTHAALYIGTAEQRKILSQQPDVRRWLSAHGAESLDGLIKVRYPRAYAGMNIPYKDGRLPRVIEAISSGVTLTSLAYSATCDSLAILRPRLSEADRAAAVVRAMRYYGRPYDYDFDFSSDNSLVCTELIVKSYLPGPSKKGLQLPMENLMGHMVTPANAFARRYDETVGTSRQQMNLILFLDGNEKEKSAIQSDVDAFRQSWKRPKWHILVDYAKRNKE